MSLQCSNLTQGGNQHDQNSRVIDGRRSVVCLYQCVSPNAGVRSCSPTGSACSSGYGSGNRACSSDGGAKGRRREGEAWQDEKGASERKKRRAPEGRGSEGPRKAQRSGEAW